MTPRALRAALKRRMDALLAHIRAELDPDLVVASFPIPDRYMGRDLKPGDVVWNTLVDEEGNRPAGEPGPLDYQRELLRLWGVATVADTVLSGIAWDEKECPVPFPLNMADGDKRDRLSAGNALKLVASSAPKIVEATANSLARAVDSLMAANTREAALARLVDRWPVM